MKSLRGSRETGSAEIMGKLTVRSAFDGYEWVAWRSVAEVRRPIGTLAAPLGARRGRPSGALSSQRAERCPVALAERARLAGELASVDQAASGGARQRASGRAMRVTAGL